MKNKFLIWGLLFTFLFAMNYNANAEYVDNETPIQEENERDYFETELPRSRAGLTIPTEGVNDKIVDTKNAAGVMTERKFYYKNKLVEKRTYTSTASSNCRMRNKYLYYSDGSTIERHRTYSNTGATCYNLQTKTYRTDKTLNGVSIYEGKVDGKVIENRYYDITGTYYKEKRYYTNGILKTREYWKGAASNYITHIANMNSAGTEWQNAKY